MTDAPAEGAIAVLGPGGIGGLVAARTGALCVGTPRTVQAIRRDGLRLVHDGTTTVVPLDAVERLERPVGLLVVAVKAYDLDEAIAHLDPSLLAEATVLPLLNGLEHVDHLRSHFTACDDQSQARSPVVVAASIGGVEVYSPDPGVVVQRTDGARVSAASDELEPEVLERALEPLRASGIEVSLEVGERAVLWEKAVRLAVVAAATIASGCSVGELRASTVWRERMRRALDEAVVAAAADDVHITASDQWVIIESLPSDLTPSAARDAAAGRPTELDAITGSVVRAGARLGVPTPALDELLAEARQAIVG